MQGLIEHSCDCMTVVRDPDSKKGSDTKEGSAHGHRSNGSLRGNNCFDWREPPALRRCFITWHDGEEDFYMGFARGSHSLDISVPVGRTAQHRGGSSDLASAASF